MPNRIRIFATIFLSTLLSALSAATVACAQVIDLSAQAQSKLVDAGEWNSRIDNVKKLPPPGQIRCNQKGEIYVRVPYPYGEVRRLDGEGYDVTSYALTERDLMDSTRVFNVALDGNVFAAYYRYDKDRQHRVPVIVEFDGYGNKKSEVKLEGLPQNFDILQLAVFKDGGYFVSGRRTLTSNAARQVQEPPLNAVFSAEGKLLKAVKLDGDEPEPAGVPERRYSYRNDMELTNAVLNGDAVSGQDGRIFVVRQAASVPVVVETPAARGRRPQRDTGVQGSRVVINAISRDGSITKMQFQNYLTEMVPSGMQESKGRLTLQLKNTRYSGSYYILLDEKTGDTLGTFDSSASSTAFACYQSIGLRHQFTVLRINQPNDRLAVATAVSK